MVKKIFALAFILIVCLTLVYAQKIEISTIKEAYSPEENITLRITLLDYENRPINEEINLIFEDVEKRKRVDKTALANKIIEIKLDENPPSGFWTVVASYKGNEARTSFLIESNEFAKFSLDKDVLTIKNIGNSKYSKTIQIVIGEYTVIKKPLLEIGESTNFRLVAPKGKYNIKISDGTTTLTKGNVALTGNAIGAIDENYGKVSPITGIASYENIKENKFVYAFILAVFGAAILLGIERYYRKKSRY